MKRRVGYVVAGAVLMVAALVSVGLTARPSAAGDGYEGQGGDGFSERSIKGYWGFNTDLGYLMPPAAPQPTPTVAVGRIHFDGEGGCSVANVINVDGQSASFQSSSCSYSVEPDGRGQAEAVFPGAPITDPVPVAFVIVDRAREIRFINTRGLVGSFTARRQ